jgi:hypothetical protein
MEATHHPCSVFVRYNINDRKVVQKEAKKSFAIDLERRKRHEFTVILAGQIIR